MERLYRVSEVARMLNVSTVAVRKWIRLGRLRARRVGKLWRYQRVKLSDFSVRRQGRSEPSFMLV